MSQAIYLDAGAWQSRETGFPSMDFAVIEHNFIALCSYFFGENKASTISSPKSFDYLKSNTCIVLTEILRHKLFGAGMKNLNPNPAATTLFIRKYLVFEDLALLDTKNKIILMVPDLHLHYFKNTLCDNFITWYEEKLDASTNKFHYVKLKNRRSMESDFCNFLKGIEAYQKQGGDVSTRFLGDLYEMWETDALVNAFCIRHNSDSAYKTVDALIEWLCDNYHGTGVISDFLRDIKAFKFSKNPLDTELSSRLNKLKEDKNLVENLFFDPDDSAGVIEQKAKFMAGKIRDQYKSVDGEKMFDIYDRINWKRILYGNHDNFFNLSSCEPLSTFLLGDLEIPLLNPNESNKNCEMLYAHGHEFDSFNNDKACGSGYLITFLLALLEAKKAGDLLKNYEGRFRQGDIRIEYMKGIAKIFFNWDVKKAAGSKNKIIAVAHTHIPYLADMSNEYKIWASVKKSIDAQSTGKRIKIYGDTMVKDYR